MGHSVTGKHIVGMRIFTRNLFANWVGLGADILVAFFLTPFIVSSLGLSTYGIWSLLNSVVGYMGLIDLGIRGSTGRYINYYMARNDDVRVNEVICTSLLFLSAVSLLAVGVSYIIAAYFSILFPSTPPDIVADLKTILPLMAANLWLALITSVFRNILGALDRFDISNAIHLLILTIRTAGVVYVLRQEYGLLGLVWVSLLSSAIGAIILLPTVSFLNKSLRITWIYVRWDRLKELWNFGLAVFVTRAAKQLIYQSDQIIVMIFFGPTMVGIYSIATMIVHNADKLSELIEATLHPSVQKSGSVKDWVGLRLLYLWNARLSIYFGTLLYIGLVVYGGDFLTLWMGDGFEGAAMILTIISLASLASLLSSNGPTILFSVDKIKLNIGLTFAHAATNIAIALILCGLLGYGVEGVAIGTLASTIIVRSIAYPIFVSKVITMPISQYMTTIVYKAIVLAIGSYIIFGLVRQLNVDITWAILFYDSIASSLIYLPIAIFIIFSRPTWIYMWNKIIDTPFARKYR